MTAYGFRIVGECRNDRRLIDWQRAFDAHCQADDRADVNREAYLSAFTFGSAFRQHLESTGSTKGYDGECFAFWLWFDIDREHNLEAATSDARRLCAGLCERFKLDGDELLIFYSGSKGFHVGLPTSLWSPCGTFRSFTAELEFRYPIRARHRLVARRLKKERWRPPPQHSPNCKPHGNNPRLSHRHQRSPCDATSTRTEPTGRTNRHRTEPAGF